MTEQEKSFWRAALAVLEPVDYGLPSEFAAKHRLVKEGASETPGPWSNERFPALTGLMDAILEAYLAGKKGVAIMKGAQVGGSDAVANGVAYMKSRFGGPALYLHAKDDVAEEFSRDRLGYMLDTMQPLAAKALRGKKAGESLGAKRFVDGKIMIQSGRSVLNVQSEPYKFVYIDELDSFASVFPDLGELVKIAETRTDSYEGGTLLVCFSHPTSKTRGVGKLFYELSDQRRAFVACPSCAEEFWFDFERLCKVVPKEGQTLAQAERDPDCLRMACPECGNILSDAERRVALRKIKWKSALPPEEAARKNWIGLHLPQMCSPHLPMKLFAENWLIAKRDENAMIVFQNKRCGEVYEPRVQAVSADDWRRLAVVPRGPADRESWRRGQVPYGVRFLTAGQDSRSVELHWAVWGWGLRKDSGNLAVLCGRLVDWGIVPRTFSLDLDPRELAVFDGLLYNRLWPSSYDSGKSFRVVQGGHDIGWNHVAVNEYCRRNPWRALPVKGAGESMSSRSTSPPVRPGRSLEYMIGDKKIKDDRIVPLILNTFLLKNELYGMVAKTVEVADGLGLVRKIPRLQLPADLLETEDGERFIREVCAEVLQRNPLQRHDELVWKAKGPNHFADCTVYALSCALNLNPLDASLPFGGDGEEEKPPAAPRPANPAEPTVFKRYGRSEADWIAER